MSGAGLLIVNADDWGGNRTATDAIHRCFETGVITSATAMVHMSDSRRAASISAAKSLPLGLHLNLTQPFDGEGVPEAVRERQLRLVRHFSRLRLRRWTYDPLVHRQVERAISDQLKCFGQLYGRPPDHVDGHNHVQVSPDVLLALPRGTKVRNAHTPVHGSRPARAAVALRRALLWRRVETTDGFYSIRRLHPRLGGAGLEAVCRRWLHATVEIMVHPARADELALLLGQEWRRIVDGAPLGSFADLGQG